MTRNLLFGKRNLRVLAVSFILASTAFGTMNRGRLAARAEQGKTPVPVNPADTTQQEQEKHFTPEIEKFVETFKPAGEGVEGASTKAPAPEESLRFFKLSEGLQMDIVASEPTIRQPLNLHFDERGRLWVVQYIPDPPSKEWRREGEG